MLLTSPNPPYLTLLSSHPIWPSLDLMVHRCKYFVTSTINNLLISYCFLFAWPLPSLLKSNSTPLLYLYQNTLQHPLSCWLVSLEIHDNSLPLINRHSHSLENHFTPSQISIASFFFFHLNWCKKEINWWRSQKQSDKFIRSHLFVSIFFTFSPLSVDTWSWLPSKASPSRCGIPFPTWQQELHWFPSSSGIVKVPISTGSISMHL